MVDPRAGFVDALTGLAGSRLEGVRYHLLRDPYGQESEPDFADTGFLARLQEVELRFDSGRLAFVTWGQGRGWRGDCSVIVSARHVSPDPDAYREVEASEATLWRSHVGQPLVDVQVLGWRDTPYLVMFVFASGPLLVGTGCTELDSFGDGQDVFIRPCDLRYLAEATLIWREVA